MKRTAIVIFLLLILLSTTPWGTSMIAWEVVDLGEDNAKSIFDIKVGNGTYAVELHYLFDPEEEGGHEKALKVAGGSLRGVSGEWDKLGAAFDMDVMVLDKVGGAERHHCYTVSPNTYAASRSVVYAEICRFFLPKGSYRVEVERFGRGKRHQGIETRVAFVKANQPK